MRTAQGEKAFDFDMDEQELNKLKEDWRNYSNYFKPSTGSYKIHDSAGGLKELFLDFSGVKKIELSSST